MASKVAASKVAASTIGPGGKVFFGSLCAGTFGLGCWQLQRLIEKQSMIEQRNSELSMEPTHMLEGNGSERPFQRRILQGTFQHDKEVLIGPRGAPSGVQIPRQGLSAKAGKAASGGGGGAPGPQGFHVLTPLEMKDAPGRSLVWINRGWVPKTLVPGSDRVHGQQATARSIALTENYPAWTRPEGTVEVTTIRSKTETPKIIAPEHDYRKQPLQLFWLDSLALQAIAENEDETVLMVQIGDEDKDADNQNPEYPLRPPLESVAEFKTTPSIHAGYAATWYGLSGAGIYMMRKMVTKGRG